MADDTWAPYSGFAHHVAAALQCGLKDAHDKIVEAIMSDKVRFRLEGREMLWADLVETGRVEKINRQPPSDRWLPDVQVFFPNVELNRASVFRWLQLMQPKPIAAGAKRGRKASYNWEEAWAFMLGVIHNEGWPETHTEMANRVAAWFAENYDQQPVMSEIYRRVKRAHRAISDN
jgi:hypothetical protein